MAHDRGCLQIVNDMQQSSGDTFPSHTAVCSVTSIVHLKRGEKSAGAGGVTHIEHGQLKKKKNWQCKVAMHHYEKCCFIHLQSLPDPGQGCDGSRAISSMQSGCIHPEPITGHHAHTHIHTLIHTHWQFSTGNPSTCVFLG